MALPALELVAAIVQAIEPSRDAAAAARVLEDLLREGLELEDASLYLAEPGGDLRGRDGRLPREVSFAAAVRATAKPLRAELAAHPWPGAAHALEKRGASRLAGLPLLARGQLRGIAVLAFSERSSAARLSDGELAALASALGVALEQARLAEAMRARAAVDRALLDAARFAASSDDLEAVLDRHAEALARIARATRCGIALPDPGDPERLALRGLFGATEEDRAELRQLALRRDADLIAQVLETKRLVLGGPESARTATTRRLFAAAGSPALAALPLLARGAVRGIAFLAHEGTLDEEARALLEAVGHEVALAIESAEERDAARSAAERQVVEAEVRSSVHSSFDLDRILGEAVEKLGRALGADRCIVGAAEPDGATAITHEYRVPHLPSALSWRFRNPDRPAARAADAKPEPLVVTDVDADPRFGGLASIAPGDYRAFVLVPYALGRLASGGLLAGSMRPRVWTEEEVRLVRAVAEQLAIAVERARIHEDAQRRADELELVLAQMTDGLVMCNERLEVVRVNAAARRIIFDRPLAPPLPISFQKISVHDVDGRELGFDEIPLGRAILHGETTSNRVLVIRERETGKEKFIACSGSPLKDGAGKLLGGIFVFRDVTEARAAAEAASRTEKLRVVGELAASVAHELNNTLAAVLGRAEIIQRATQEGETRRNADVIAGAARDATHVLGRLTRLSHKPRADAPRSEVDLVQTAADALELTRPRWSRLPGVTVTIAAEAENIVVRGVAAELREVFTNLILNAVDAVSAGGSIRVSLSASAEQATIRVVDDGCGMREEVLRRAFEPFFTTKGEAGTGLGLNICSAIVTAHGGCIEARSVPGQGTTIEIRLPLDETETPRHPLVVSRLTILAVDDDPRVLSVLREALARDGHVVETASSGEEALERIIAAAEKPQVLVTDVSMPGMSGVHLAEEVFVRSPRTALVLVSGWAASASSDALARLGAAMVTKPFGSEDVRVAIAKALSRRR